MSSRMEGSVDGGKRLRNNPKFTYSKQTQDMLKLMIKQSSLSNFQRKQISKCLSNGTALPLTCSPPPPEPKQKIIKPAPNDVPPKPQKRTAESCRAGDNYKRDRFLPCPTRDLEKEKNRLQNVLANGREKPEPTSSHKCPAHPKPDVADERDRFEEVLEEIEERREFLASMTKLGQERSYSNLINTEISQKIRELELIDKARSAEVIAVMESKKPDRKTDAGGTATQH